MSPARGECDAWAGAGLRSQFHPARLPLLSFFPSAPGVGLSFIPALCWAVITTPGIAFAAVLLPLLAQAVPAPSPAPALPGFIETIPPRSQEVLFNPRMGLYLQHPPTGAKADEWFMSISDIAYYRLDWSAVNPAPGICTFDQYFGPLLDFWVKQRGKRFAFRVMSQSMHSQSEFVTPQWVFAEGVPGVRHTGLNGKQQTDPVFWDERYLDAQCAFVKQLGAYFADKPGIEFVDIGGIGEWGEMHLARWTPRQLDESGYSEFRYAQAYRRLIDAYVAAFPHTQVFLNIGGQNHHSINDYAALRGVHFRQDGLTPAGASYDCGEWLYQPYSRRGVLCNFEFHSSYPDMLRKNWDLRQTVEKGLAAPISYLNTNLFGGSSIRQAPEEVRALLSEAARRIGYRFVLTSLKHPARLKTSPARRGRLPLEATWSNEGVAPCYDSFALRWSLVDAAGKVAAQEDNFPLVPTTLWHPGATVAEKALLRTPAGLAAGDYRLQVSLVDPQTGRLIRLGIGGRQSSGAYDLASISAAPAADEIQAVVSWDFEGGGPAWQAAAGMQARVEPAGGHEAPGHLLLSGSAANSWNYASMRAGPALPYARYRFSAWVKLEELSHPQKPPYLKLGINDSQGKWLANAATNSCDAKLLGAWQLLEGFADMPPQAGSLDFALEKGDKDTPVTVTLRLDDVRLEIVEAP